MSYTQVFPIPDRNGDPSDVTVTLPAHVVANHQVYIHEDDEDPLMVRALDDEGFITSVVSSCVALIFATSSEHPETYEVYVVDLETDQPQAMRVVDPQGDDFISVGAPSQLCWLISHRSFETDSYGNMFAFPSEKDMQLLGELEKSEDNHSSGQGRG